MKQVVIPLGRHHNGSYILTFCIFFFFQNNNLDKIKVCVFVKDQTGSGLKYRNKSLTGLLNSQKSQLFGVF